MVKCFIEFSLTIYSYVYFEIFLAGPFFPALMRCHTSGEGVSGPVVRPTDRTHARLVTNGYLRMEHGRGRYNGIGMISRGLLDKSSLFRYIILM